MILLYHKIFPISKTPWWVDVDSFYRQMLELRNKKVVYLDDFNRNDENQAVITFDGVYENVLQFAAPILKEFNYPFELFIIGNYLGADNTFDTEEPDARFADLDDLKKLIESGGRLQWHTKSHSNLGTLEDIETIREEISVPQYLKRIDPKGFNWFAFPNGRYNSTVLDEVRRTFRGALGSGPGNTEGSFFYDRVIVTNRSRLSTTAVAVIISSYNYGCFLVEAIESALRQTIPPDEILITDDFSSDNTQEIALEYQQKYPHLVNYNRNEKNLGRVENFRKAVTLTTSDYIVFLGADNRLMSNYIEETKRVLDSSEEIAIAYTDCALFGPRAEIRYNQFDNAFRGEIKGKFFIITFPEWGKNSKDDIKQPNFIHGSAMYKRCAYHKVGGYRSEGTNPEDHDLFLRILQHGWTAQKAKRTLLEYRQHSYEQASTVWDTLAELNFYKQKCRELLDEKERLSRRLIYKILKPLMLTEKACFILKREGLKALAKRLLNYGKRKLH